MTNQNEYDALDELQFVIAEPEEELYYSIGPVSEENYHLDDITGQLVTDTPLPKSEFYDVVKSVDNIVAFYAIRQFPLDAKFTEDLSKRIQKAIADFRSGKLASLETLNQEIIRLAS